jgi:hypothetical protein
MYRNCASLVQQLGSLHFVENVCKPGLGRFTFKFNCGKGFAASCSAAVQLPHLSPSAHPFGFEP